jgi:hypothetical protein
LLGIVLIMLMVLMAASVFAFFTLRTDSGATANDRLARQLFDCAEQGLAIGKTTFSATSAVPMWPQYFAGNLTSGPNALLPTNFPAPGTGTAVPGYPYQPNTPPLSIGQIAIPLGVGGNSTLILNQVVAIYNNPGDQGGLTSDNDNQVIVWAQCTEPNTKQSRTVQALLFVPPQKNGNYFGQAGFGYNNSGNTNNTR